MQEVEVISHHAGKPIEDSHRGIGFVFKPNEKVRIPVPAAVHIFGFGMKDRSSAWKRVGYTDSIKGEAYLNKFELKAIDLVPADSGQEVLLRENEELKARIAELEAPPKKHGKKEKE